MKNTEVLVKKELGVHGLAVCLKPSVPFVMTASLIHEIRNLQDSIAEQYYTTPWEQAFHVIWYLHFGKITIKGLDFNYIHQNLIQHHDSALESYIGEVFDVLFLNYISLGLPVVNCSIVARNLNGCAQEFFFMNQISFIKSNLINNPNDEKQNRIFPFQLQNEIKKCYFPQYLYQTNLYYSFSHINVNHMKSIIHQFKHPYKKENEWDKVKKMFDQMKNKTLEKIYHTASKKPCALKRMADIQPTEHFKHKLNF